MIDGIGKADLIDLYATKLRLYADMIDALLDAGETEAAVRVAAESENVEAAAKALVDEWPG